MRYRSNFLSCDIDFDAKGKNFDVARLVYSDDDNANRVFLIPIVTIANGEGPTALLCAGNHGNEDEGQLILRRLIHDLDPDDVQGRIIVLPAMNYPAVRASTRVSPLDGENLNRSFPGDGTAGPTRAIARFIVDALLPMADAGMDLHSGSYFAEFVGTTFLCTSDDLNMHQASFEMADAFNMPYMYVVDGTGSPTGFDGSAHAQNVPFMSTELGGGGIDRDILRQGSEGVHNVLAHLGIVAPTAGGRDRNDTVYLDAVTGSGAVTAPFAGSFEAHFDAGDEVEPGQTAGYLYSLDEIEREPVELKFTKAGVVAIKAVSARVVQGTRIAVTASAVDRDAIPRLGGP